MLPLYPACWLQAAAGAAGASGSQEPPDWNVCSSAVSTAMLLFPISCVAARGGQGRGGAVTTHVEAQHGMMRVRTPGDAV
jgi:hypothetical protein